MNFYYCKQCNTFWSLTDEQKLDERNVCRCRSQSLMFIYTDTGKYYFKDRTFSVAQLMSYLTDKEINSVKYKGELITIKQLDDLILLESL